MTANRVKIETTMGSITLELDSAKAPNTVANFLQYVEDDFYTGTIFHRVIDGFMVQGGGLDAKMNNKPTQAPIKNEADNGLSNLDATVAMARTNDPHSATAQFFINVKDNLFLNHTSPTPDGWGYCVFGRVVDGYDTVSAMKTVETGTSGGMRDVPTQAIEIVGVTLLHE
ncbi:MAG: peptidylprolyl isomerase [Proteobacteria bacterium]|nr:peptidylprolyl isomerase [Pseudomonadota bacterium]